MQEDILVANSDQWIWQKIHGPSQGSTDQKKSWEVLDRTGTGSKKLGNLGPDQTRANFFENSRTQFSAFEPLDFT